MGYDYTGSSSTNPYYGKAVSVISTAVASVVATATSGPSVPDGNLVVIAKPGPDKVLAPHPHKNSFKGRKPL